MAVAFDAKTAAVKNVNTVALLDVTNMTVGASLSNGILIAMIGFANSSTPPGLAAVWDFGGTAQTMTAVPGTNSGTHGGLSGSAVIFAVLNPTAGNKTLRFTWTGNFEAHAVAASFTGVDQTSVAVACPGGAVNFFDTAQASPASVTVSSATGDMVVACCMENFSAFGTISGTLIAKDDTTGPNQVWAGTYTPGAATVTSTYAFSVTGDYGCVGCSIKAASGGGATGAGASAGIGAAAAVGRSLANSAGASAGTGAATATAQGLFPAAGASAGVGAAQATGTSLSNGTASSAGVGTAGAAGQGIANSLAASSGLGTATGVGDFTAPGNIAAATGTGTAAGIGASLAAGLAASSGSGSAQAVGATVGIISAIASSAGISIVLGVSYVGDEDRPPGGAGIAMGRAFTRKRWKELQDLIVAEQAAAAKARRVGSPTRSAALVNAVTSARHAIAALEGVEVRAQFETEMEGLATQLAAATSAKKAMASIAQAHEAGRAAAELYARVEAFLEEEDEEIRLLLE